MKIVVLEPLGVSEAYVEKLAEGLKEPRDMNLFTMPQGDGHPVLNCARSGRGHPGGGQYALKGRGHRGLP